MNCETRARDTFVRTITNRLEGKLTCLCVSSILVWRLTGYDFVTDKKICQSNCSFYVGSISHLGTTAVGFPANERHGSTRA